jgi:hypothetical protein
LLNKIFYGRNREPSLRPLSKADQALEELAPLAQGRSEILSIQHQRDLLVAAQSRELAWTLTDLGVDREALTMGIVDSDAGKLKLVWQTSVLEPSASSDAFLEFLQGRGAPRAALELRQLLDQAGFQGLALLNPHLTKDQLRRLLTALPVLRGFLHELPGLQRAFVAFEKFEITPRQFRLRVAANLFHNDGAGSSSDAGFWQVVLTRNWLPQALDGSDDPVARMFFKETVFQGRIEDGRVRPRYPAPISCEGLVHAILDRTSQGTRGGLLKLMAELQNSDVEHSAEVLNKSPQLTVEQLQGILTSLARMPFLNDRQKGDIATEITIRITRLQREIAFLKERIIFSGETGTGQALALYFKGESSPTILLPDAPPEWVAQQIDRLLQEEERANGNPMLLEPNSLLRLFRRFGL